MEIRNQKLLVARIRNVKNEKRQRRERVNVCSGCSALKINERSDARGSPEKKSSNERAAREKVHDRADDCVGSDSLEQRRAAGNERHANDKDGADDGDDLLDSFLAGADPGDMLADTDAATGAEATTLYDKVGAAFRAFDFGPQGHRIKVRRDLL